MNKTQIEALFDQIQAIHSNEPVELTRFDMLKLLQQVVDLIDERDQLLKALQINHVAKTALLRELEAINFERSNDND